MIARAGYLVVVLLATCLMAGCATTDVAPIEAAAEPAPDTDEAGLWQVMDEAERDLQASSVLVRDEALNAYVGEIVCRVSGEAYCDDIRVYVVEQPYFNANMAPNGMMQVWTGLLLRAENEAQLAFVLGHEVAHYRQRHSLQRWREMGNAANASLAVSFGAAMAGVPEATVLGNFALAARIYGYGRDQEREADADGYRYLTDAGYDGDAAAAIWDYLIDEVESSDSKRKQRRIARASIFSTHPVSSERVETLRGYAEEAGPGAANEARFDRMIAPYLEQWLEDDLVLRDFGTHLHLIDHKIERGANLGILYFRRAEALRIRRDEGDLEAALTDYERAVTYGDAPADAWRALGEAYRRDGREQEADAAFATYLQLSPDAADRLMVERYMSTGEE